MSKYCCGIKINETFKYCPICGKPIEKEDTNKENNAISNFYRYTKAENGLDIFSIVVTVSNKTISQDIAEGRGAMFCNNGILAMELLERKGYSFKYAEIPVLLSSQFDLYDKNCVILSPEVIAKLYQVSIFFELLGYQFTWNKIPELLEVDFSDFLKIEKVEILKKVMKSRMYMEMPVDAENKLREGEKLLLKKNYTDALEWYKNLIEINGDSNGYACNIIGKIFIYLAENSDDNVQQSYEEAEKWLEKSAKCGNLLGYLNLALMYENGNGVEKDIERALSLNLKAYEQGSTYAINCFNDFLSRKLIDIHETGFKMEESYDYEPVADKLEKTEKKFTSTLLKIGYIYQHGLGRTISLEKAIYYYRKVARESNEDGVFARRMLNDIRREGNALLVNNDTYEQSLKRAGKIARIIYDAQGEKAFLKEEIFGEPQPLKPKYTDCWLMEGQLEDYEENVCYSVEELKLETQVYTYLLEIYNTYKNQWRKNQDTKIVEIEKKIEDYKNELYSFDTYIKDIGYSLTNATCIEELAIVSDISELMGITIEEGIYMYKTIQHGGIDENKIKDRKYVIEGLKKLFEIEGKITQLNNEDRRLKSCAFNKEKPIKPAYRYVLHKDAPPIVYKGRVCETEQDYRNRLNLYFQEMNRYYNEKIHWLDLQPMKRLEIKKEIEELKHRTRELYDKIGIPYRYKNQEALDFIRKFLESTQSTLQTAYEEFDKYKKRQKEKAERELERKKAIEAEQQRILLEESKRKIERWEREYEEQELAREKAYEERYGKKDLFGSTVCIKRFQKHPFDFEHSCTFCPQARYCTRA